jgi:uncharacterized protein (TIGR02246 family)
MIKTSSKVFTKSPATARTALKLARIWLVAALMGSLPLLASDAFNAKDEAAIRQVIGHWDKMWHGGDVREVTNDYTDDAEWMNAFGTYRKGGSAILSFFAPFGKMNRNTTVTELRIRYVRPDVAAVWESYETVDQRTAGGAVYPPRKTHSLRILTKTDGRWLIISHLIMDEKERLP